MLNKINQLLVKLFGSRNERVVKLYLETALAAGEYENTVSKLTDAQLKQKTAQFKTSIAEGTNPRDILPEAFAVMREASDRHLGIRNTLIPEYGFDPQILSNPSKDIYNDLLKQIENGTAVHDLDVPTEYNAEIRSLFPESKPPFRFRHFDVQVVGGNVLYEGKIAEMATGEGKTLVATLAAYLVHLTGRKVHVVTVNDYLARRDAAWMEPAFNALGLTVGAIQSDQDPSGDDRRKQYNCDITYGTNNEFGFDYLRDNMKVSIEQMAQGPLEFALIDEVDSILIDEARTPLIISGPAHDDVTKYKKSDSVVRQLITMQAPYDRIKHRIDMAEREIANAKGELAEARQQKDSQRTKQAQAAIDTAIHQKEKAETELEAATEYYSIEIDRKAVRLTEQGEIAAQEIAGVGSFYTGSNSQWPHLIEQSLRAYVCFVREKDYVVMDNKVVIVDEFTGRLMEGRQWSDGLHQAVEAKENVQIKEETQTLATITLQNFFKLYGDKSGMTGTAATEADEFMQIYDLDVVVIPTNKPCVRDDREDLIFKTIREKFNAIVEGVNDASKQGRPVLVGTISVEKSEALSMALTKKYGIEHEVLNAKQHAREASIVEKAGSQHRNRSSQMCGNVTIATNMAGRGTDIKLSPEVVKLGGLHVVGTERHESRRIDNQLRGRAGRQGDAGSSEFYLCFDDDLLKIFMPDWTIKALTKVGWEENQPIYNRSISKGIERAQKKVENRNFESRKSLLDYDEVMDHQRKYFYGRRRRILEGAGLDQIISEMIQSSISKACSNILNNDYAANCIIDWARNNFDVELAKREITDVKVDEIENIIKERATRNVSSNISLSMGEYLQDYQDSSTWDVNGLCKWAMSSFSVDVSASKVRQMAPEEIEDMLIQAATKQIENKDCSDLVEFLHEDFPAKTLNDWANGKFGIKLDTNHINRAKAEEVQKYLLDEVEKLKKQREIEYPVEFAMNMAFGSEEANIYAFDALSGWAKSRFDIDMEPEDIRNSKPKDVHDKLIELSEKYNNGLLEEEVDQKISNLQSQELADWVKTRFDTTLSEDELSRENIISAGKKMLRKELTDLEKYILVQIYDSTWKDHLYAMDHLKESIFLRSFAEKDPKIEYRQEGFKMFNEMIDSVEDRVTDIIFKVRLTPGEQARSVWNISNSKHDQVNQFAMAEKQRAAATAPQPQGEPRVKQVVLEQPKVGRNDPCPCGSGKKYKKCCGQN